MFLNSSNLFSVVKRIWGIDENMSCFLISIHVFFLHAGKGAIGKHISDTEGQSVVLRLITR